MAEIKITGFVEKVENNTVFITSWEPKDKLYSTSYSLSQTPTTYPPTAKKGKYLKVRLGKLTEKDVRTHYMGYEIDWNIKLRAMYFKKTNSTTVIATFDSVNNDPNLILG